jgi:hypothetical protein
MKALWYLLTLILGLWGLLSLFRFIEALLTGGGLYVMQLLLAIACLLLARKCLDHARTC